MQTAKLPDLEAEIWLRWHAGPWTVKAIWKRAEISARTGLMDERTMLELEQEGRRVLVWTDCEFEFLYSMNEVDDQ